MTAHQSPEGMMNRKQAAEYAKVSAETIQRWMGSGIVQHQGPNIRLKRELHRGMAYIKPEWIEEFLDHIKAADLSRPETPPPPSRRVATKKPPYAFVQITGDSDGLFALDRVGQVWRYRFDVLTRDEYWTKLSTIKKT